MVRLYNIQNRYWHRSPVAAFWGYLRDLLIHAIPFKLPNWLRHKLYGIEANFVFLVHPRQTEDIYRALPFLTILRKFVSKKMTLKIFKHSLPCVIGTIKTSAGVNGLVVSSFYLPEILMDKNKDTLKEARKCIDFSHKLLPVDSYVGLGAWWPIVTRRGLAIKQYAEKRGIYITNGHTGTLISLVLTIDKITKLAGIDMKDLKIAIIGSGRMGSNLVRVLSQKNIFLGIIDINEKRVKRLIKEITDKNNKVKVEMIVRNDSINMEKVLNKFDLAVCVTSSARRILKNSDIPKNFIVIDDSRPEAISREELNGDKIALEGGLIRIKHLLSNYDYGFGIDDNVFGCLAETYALSLDKGRELNPTLGNVDLNNYKNMMNFFIKNGLKVGSFKSGKDNIDDLKLKEMIINRKSSEIMAIIKNG